MRKPAHLPNSDSAELIRLLSAGDAADINEIASRFKRYTDHMSQTDPAWKKSIEDVDRGLAILNKVRDQLPTDEYRYLEKCIRNEAYLKVVGDLKDTGKGNYGC